MTANELDERVEGPVAAEEGEVDAEVGVMVEEEAPEVELELQEIEPEVLREPVVPLEEFRPPTGEIIREETAEWLAKAITIVFGVVVIGFLVGSFLNVWWVYFYAPAARTDGGSIPGFDQVLNIAETLLPYLATPLGVALGYYFSKRAAGR